MRIAMMTNNYKPVVGGVPLSVERLSAALRKRGHQVGIFAPQHPRQEPEGGVIRCRSWSLNEKLPSGGVIPGLFDPEIEKSFLCGRYDVIHMHHPMLLGYTGLYFSRKYGIPSVLTYHTRYEQHLHHFGPYGLLQKYGGGSLCKGMRRAAILHNRIFANACNLVFAPSPSVREHLYGSGVTTPVRVLPTGLGEEDFQWNPEHATEIRRKMLGDTERSSLFCTVSRLEEEKNIPFLLRSAARLKTLWGERFCLMIIGNGSRRAALEAQAAELGVSGCVRFLGTVDHRRLGDYYHASDLFVFASKSETQGMVIQEAMAASLPVVAVEAGGVCDVVEDGYNGWKTGESEEEFTSRLLQVATDAQFRRRLGEGARYTASQYTMDQMAANAGIYYSSIVDQAPAQGIPSDLSRRRSVSAW